MIVFGNKWFFDSKGLVNHPCPQCGKQPCELCWGRNKATAYWIPTFTMEQSYALKCMSCNEHYILEKAVGDRLLMEAQGHPAPAPTASAPATPAAALSRGAVAPSAPAALSSGNLAARPAEISCARCNNQVAAGARFCHMCGAPVPQPRACPSCSQAQTSGKFCSQCGTQMPDAAQEEPVHNAPAGGA
jgi:hypothetical protein